MDNWIGLKFFYVGFGYGGFCFLKDMFVLFKIVLDVDFSLKIIDFVIDVNVVCKEKMVDKVIDFMDGDLKDKIVVLFGLVFKLNIDDMWEVFSIVIVDKL